jgi:ribosome biogenesis GTP-binding protein YsxC/EngB
VLSDSRPRGSRTFAGILVRLPRERLSATDEAIKYDYVCLPSIAQWRCCATTTAVSAGADAGSDEAASASTTWATVSDLKSFLKDKSSKGAVRKVVHTMTQVENGTGPYGHLLPDSDLYRLAVRCLLRSSRTELAFGMYKLRMSAREKRPDLLGDDVGLAASVLRAVVRDGKKRNQVELDQALLYEDIRADCTVEPLDPKTAKNKASAICTLVSALLDGDKVKETRVKDAARMVLLLKSISRAAKEAAALPVSDYNDCIRVLGKRRRLDSVFDVIDSMSEAGVERNSETFEFLANSVVRQVEFVTGAVSMATLPEPLGAEIAFVGRSNVGKSSLVNMICNRRALAYVSGRPGKTQQFNYFLVNGRDKAPSFYLVDLPGVGYARVAKSVQAEWLRFMDEYLSSRPSLEVIFHLVDSRHGAIGEDELLMQRIAQSNFQGKYVVVLTKVDKLDKQRVRQSMLDKMRAALVRNDCPSETPILLTSASSKLGRDEVWRYLRCAIRIT